MLIGICIVASAIVVPIVYSKYHRDEWQRVELQTVVDYE